MRLTISSKIKIKIEFKENILNSNLKQENINYFIFGRDCGRYNLLLLKNQFSKFAKRNQYENIAYKFNFQANEDTRLYFFLQYS